jgi:hypothetical protein
MNATLQLLIDATKEETYTDPSTVSDADALGVLIAQHFEWGCEDILECLQAACEDANMHSLNRLIDAWRAEKGF